MTHLVDAEKSNLKLELLITQSLVLLSSVACGVSLRMELILIKRKK